MSYVMETEINSQATIIENLINRYIINYCVLMDIPIEIKRISIIASGSSYNAGVFGKYFFENISNIPTSVDFASELIGSKFNNFDCETLYVFLSQSGLSVDTVEAMKKVKESNAKTLCITNNLHSTMYSMADYRFYIEAGLENAIAATKTFSATVVMLWLIALKAAQNKHIDISEETKEIYSIKKNIEFAMKNLDNLELCARTLSKLDGFAVFGYGMYYPLALEAALKIRETSYINTSAYPSGEFVHGHFALLNKTKAFLTFLTEDASEYELNILKKVLRTYKAKSIVVSDVYEDYDCDILLKFQKGASKISNIVNMIIVIQLLSLNIAKKLRRNIDKPQGLSKVVDNKG
ncbi:MAG: SIS domain-containing protein [Candidatus Gastranaerophilales bacterium]|nr:SIS domain-containing protein [Candidatus Gastranaerophilales bacterium]